VSVWGEMRRTVTSRLCLLIAIAALADMAFAATGCGSSSNNDTTTSTASDLETWAGSV